MLAPDQTDSAYRIYVARELIERAKAAGIPVPEYVVPVDPMPPVSMGAEVIRSLVAQEVAKDVQRELEDLLLGPERERRRRERAREALTHEPNGIRAFLERTRNPKRRVRL